MKKNTRKADIHRSNLVNRRPGAKRSGTVNKKLRAKNRRKASH